MYFKQELHGIECDNCGEFYQSNNTDFAFFMTEGDAIEMAWDDGWYEDPSGETRKHYCEKCHTIDDDDNLILKVIPPVYEVIAEFPGNKDFPLGKKIDFAPFAASDSWVHCVEDCQGKREYLQRWFDNYPHLFSRIKGAIA